MITLPASLEPAITALLAHGLRPVVVGGYVRDSLLQQPSKDIDIEVFGVETLEELEQLLSSFGKVNSVGKSFGVLKLQLASLEVDFSLPRREKKTALGHKGFEVRHERDMDFETAASRRDFTINAMGFDLQTKVLLDPFNGRQDLQQKRLHMVDAKAFAEDPLRLYRAAQFAARFELTPTRELMALMQQMVRQKMIEELPKERVFEEFRKLLLKSRRPSVGFEVMSKCGVLVMFPELLALQGVPQDPLYHPEGDVWRHTLMVVDAMSRLHGSDEKRNLYLSLAALCHDLGKAVSTKIVDGRIRAIGHESTGLVLTEQLIRRLSDEKALLEKILPLVKHHLKPLQFFKQGAKSAAIRRLATEVNIEDLILLAKADFLGRTTPEAKSGRFEAGEWLQQRAEVLSVSNKAPKPLLQGRDLVAAGLRPSRVFKEILDRSYEAQIRGEITDREEARSWLQKELQRA